jgi:ubiquinone/menaquinone biosynthesis C-methylase UbiE
MTIKYDKIGIGYNSTRRADPYLVQRLILLLNPVKDAHYLDIGCGTGNYTTALADTGLKFTGIDPSGQMLTEARSKRPDIEWLTGSAEQIPSGDRSFSGIIATLTIHHWTNLTKAFVELNRVLSDGRIVLFTSTPDQMRGYWLNHYFPDMLMSSIAQMPSLEDVSYAVEEAGLEVTGTEKYFIHDGLLDSFLYIGKNYPERYFDEAVRHGISSFSSLANKAEVDEGLSRLRMDIESKAFETVRASYGNGLGDYLFIVIERKGRR